MRRQDELIALYNGRDRYTRKYILSQVDSLSLAFDSEELLEFLQRELGDADDMVRHQSLFTLSRFLHGFIRKRYGLAGHSMGIWSVYDSGKLNLKNEVERAKQAPQKAIERRRAFLFRARPLAEALQKVVRSQSGATGTAARLALAQLPLKSVYTALHEACPTGGFEGALSFALVQEAKDDPRFLIDLVRSKAADQPDLCLLASAVPAGEARSLFLEMIPKVTMPGRINLAQALPRLTGIDHREILARLGRTGEGWVTIYCLRAMETLGEADYLDVIEKIYDLTQLDFVKVQAVRAAGGIEGSRTLDFCLRAVKEGGEAIQAQALETLVRLRCDLETLRHVASPLLESGSLRARVNAILATSEKDEKPPRALTDMLLGSETMSRLEGAFCLGYLQNRKSLEYLETLLKLDPSLNVRTQAVKSLSKYPARHALPRLVPALRSSNAVLAMTAARVLTRYDQDEANIVGMALIEELKNAKSSFERALLYRAIGSVAAKAELPRAVAVLDAGLEDEDPAVQLGAIEGWTHLGGAPLADRIPALQGIVRRADRRAAPRALMALVLGGDLSGLEGLSRILEGARAESIPPTIETVLELGLLVAQTEASQRYPPLAEALDGILPSGDFRQFDEVGEVSHTDLSWLIPPAEDAPEAATSRFPVRRSIRPTGVAPAAAGRLSQRIKEPPSETLDPSDPRTEGVSRLAVHLKNPKLQAEAKAELFQQKLGTTTYLLDHRFSPLPWIERLKSHKYLVLPAVAVMTILGVIVWGAYLKYTETLVADLPPLSVDYLNGEPKTEEGKAVVYGMELAGGTGVVTGPKQMVRLVTRQGDTLSVFESSQITVEKLVADENLLEIALTPGSYAFNFTGSGTLRATILGHTVEAEEARFTVGPDQGKMAVIVDKGTVTLKTPSGTEEAIEPDGDRILE